MYQPNIGEQLALPEENWLAELSDCTARRGEHKEVSAWPKFINNLKEKIVVEKL